MYTNEVISAKPKTKMAQTINSIQSYVKSKDVRNSVNGVIKFASGNPHLQNKLFDEEIRLFLQINSYKVPKVHGSVKQLFRVLLPHPPLPADSEVCLIVPDVKGVPNKEHERHIEHYETLLKSKDVTGIKKIMTFHEFRTEYDTFELKNRLANLYDLFLVDGRISGKVIHKCGSIFYKKRKVPVAVKLHLPELKSHIEKALRKVFFHLNLKSDSHSVEFGHSKMSSQHLIDNVYSILDFIEREFPGRMENIRSVNVYAHRGSSIPLYVSLRNPNEIKVPVVSRKKIKAYKSVRGELTTKYNAEVVVRPTGRVIVKRPIQASAQIEDEDNKADVPTTKEGDYEIATRGTKRKQPELQDIVHSAGKKKRKEKTSIENNGVKRTKVKNKPTKKAKSVKNIRLNANKKGGKIFVTK